MVDVRRLRASRPPDRPLGPLSTGGVDERLKLAKCCFTSSAKRPVGYLSK